MLGSLKGCTTWHSEVQCTCSFIFFCAWFTFISPPTHSYTQTHRYTLVSVQFIFVSNGRNNLFNAISTYLIRRTHRHTLLLAAMLLVLRIMKTKQLYFQEVPFRCGFLARAYQSTETGATELNLHTPHERNLFNSQTIRFHQYKSYSV